MATLPSPSKRANMFSEQQQQSIDSTPDVRGSFQRAASKGADTFADQIRFNAQNARAAVNRGALGVTPSPPLSNASRQARPLTASRTEPVLSFRDTSFAPTTSGGFQTDADIINQVYGGRRELQPMWNQGPEPVQSEASRRSASVFSSGSAGGGSGLFGVDASGADSSRATTEEVGNDGDNGGDGFDLDEVFGTRDDAFAFPSTSQATEGDSQETTATVTKQLKRAFDVSDSNETSSATAMDEDEEMALTDVEEDESMPMPLSFMNAPIGRRIAGTGRRGLDRTQSLPAHVFQNAEF